MPAGCQRSLKGSLYGSGIVHACSSLLQERVSLIFCLQKYIRGYVHWDAMSNVSNVQWRVKRVRVKELRPFCGDVFNKLEKSLVPTDSEYIVLEFTVVIFTEASDLGIWVA